MKKFNSVSTLIIIGYIIVLVITISSAILISIKNRHVEQNTNTFINDTLPQLASLESILKQTSELEIGAYSLYGLTIKKTEFAKQVKQAKQALPLSEKTPLNRQIEAYFKSLNNLQNTMAQGSVDWDQARSELAQISKHTSEIRRLLDQQKAAITELAQSGSSTIIDSIADVQKINWLMVALTCFALLAAYLISQKQIAKPIRQLSTELHMISDTLDLSSKLPQQDTDEINQATQSVNHLLAQFKNAIHDVSDTSICVQQSSTKLEAVTNSSEEAIKSLAQSIEQLITKMLDLEQQIENSVSRSTDAADAATQGAEH